MASERVSPHSSPRSSTSSDVIPTITATELSRLKEVFERHDENRDGYIDQKALKGVLIEIGVEEVTDTDVTAVLSELGGSRDDLLDFSEFVKFSKLISPEAPNTEQRSGSMSRGGKQLTVKQILALITRAQGRSAQQEARVPEDDPRRRTHPPSATPTILPEAPWRRWWDVVVLGVSAYFFVVATTQVILGYEPLLWSLVVDWLATVFMACDLYVVVHTVWVAKCLHRCGTPYSREVEEIETRAVALRLFSSGFLPLMTLGCLPVDLIAWHVAGDLSTWRVARSLRLAYLIRYRRVFLMSHRSTFTPSSVTFYCTLAPVLRTAFRIVCVCHTFVLLRLLIVPSNTDCEGVVHGLDACRTNITSKYFHALSWVVAILTAQGTVAIENDGVRAYALIIMVLSVFLQGYVLARMVSWVAKCNDTYRDKMAATLHMLRDRGVPTGLQGEVLSFQHQVQQQAVATRREGVLRSLPRCIQEEIETFTRIALISKLPTFASLSDDCKHELAHSLQRGYVEPDDYMVQCGAPGREMYFMVSGFADTIVPGPDGGVIVGTLKPGDYFGEAALVQPDLPRSASVQALTYCELLQLRYADVARIAEIYIELREQLDGQMKKWSKTSSRTSSGGHRVPVGLRERCPDTLPPLIGGQPCWRLPNLGRAPARRVGGRTSGARPLRVPDPPVLLSHPAPDISIHEVEAESGRVTPIQAFTKHEGSATGYDANTSLLLEEHEARMVQTFTKLSQWMHKAFEENMAAVVQTNTRIDRLSTALESMRDGLYAAKPSAVL